MAWRSGCVDIGKGKPFPWGEGRDCGLVAVVCSGLIVLAHGVLALHALVRHNANSKRPYLYRVHRAKNLSIQGVSGAVVEDERIGSQE